MHGVIGRMTTNTNFPEYRVSFPSGPRWYVVRTNIRCEFRAQLGIAAAGFRVFLPTITKWRRHARLQQICRVPLFPGYLFVEADFNLQPIDGIFRADGVESIINNNGVPSSIYGDFVYPLLERQLKGDFDITAAEPLPQWAKLKIMEGKYEDCEAVLARMPSKNRVELLISIMGRKVRETLALANVRPAW